MPNRFSPSVLPEYYGGNPGQAIAAALAQYNQGRRQQALDYADSGVLPDHGLLERDPAKQFATQPTGQPQAAAATTGATTGAADETSGSSGIARALAAQQQQPPQQDSADPFMGNRTQAQAGAQGYAGPAPGGFRPADTTSTMGRSNLTESMAAGSGSASMPSAATLHSNTVGEFDGHSGFIGHAPVTSGWPATPVQAPPSPPLANAGGAATAAPTAAPPAGAGGIPPVVKLPGGRSVVTALSPAGRAVSEQDIQRQQLAQSLEAQHAGEYEKGVTPNGAGGFTFNPNNPTVANATPEMLIRSRMVDLEQQKNQIDLQLGMARNDTERAGLVLQGRKIDEEMAQFQAMWGMRNENLAREMGGSFEKVNDKLYGVGDLYRDWQTKLQQARNGNPADMKAATASFQRLVDQTGTGRLGMLKYLQNINPSLAGAAEQTVNRWTKGQFGSHDLDNMDAVARATAGSTSAELDRRRNEEIGRHPEIPNYGNFVRSSTFEGAPVSGAAGGGKIAVSQAEWDKLGKQNPGVDLSQHYAVQSQP
jgi:hypothetical protein